MVCRRLHAAGLVVASVVLVAIATSAPCGLASEPDAKGIEFFEKKIRPVLVEHCFECHGGPQVKGGLRLDSRDGWKNGGDSGPAIVAGKPDESLIIQAVRYGGDYEMPPKGKLPDEVIRDFERWVAIGAPDPRDGGTGTKPSVIDVEAGRRHWSYQPIRAGHPPTTRDVSWSRNEIDKYVLARLESAGRRPMREASRGVLARRLYFDLWGLPPTEEQLAAFIEDPGADAYERLVEELLASPRYGERWGRHWLDIARFAESVTLRGFVFKEAWRYRDYVLDSWNADLPFDQFLREQIAGDLISSGSIEDRQRRLIATTFLVLGNTNFEEQDKKQLEMDVIDEQLDVIGKGILAQTITCARCHDHKFDPIPTKDYYALAGILRNTKALEHANVSKWVESPLPVKPDQEREYEIHRLAVADLKARIDQAREAVKVASSSAAGAATTESAGGAVVPLKDLPGIVVDDAQAKKVGDWKASQFTRSFIGDGYVHDLDEGKGEKTLTFAPELPRDGRYEVRFAYTASTNRADKVPVTVFSADGEKTLEIDQRESPVIDGRFVSLGQYRFERAGQSFVIVSNDGTTGHVIADAVQFIPVEMLDATTPTTAKGTAAPGTVSSDIHASNAATDLKRLEAELKKLEASAPYRPSAMTVIERNTIAGTRVHIRGSVHNLGEPVDRGFLTVCSTSSPSMPGKESGRRELAEWLVGSEHPLTSRVIVNRIWHWLIGNGLVVTVDNFGTTGDSPSHPELLDYLARDLVDNRWSTKHVVRQIVMSSTYRQWSRPGPSPDSTDRPPVDTENRWLSGMNRRRIDAECLRDAMLSVSGELRLETGGPTFPPELPSDYGYRHLDTRRSVYSPVFRNALPELFEAFDFADPSVVTGRRNISTVAPQALFMMNHAFVRDRSREAAARLLAEPYSEDIVRVKAAFRRTLGRLPSVAESESTMAFLRESGTAQDAVHDAWSQVFQALFASIDFRYID